MTKKNKFFGWGKEKTRRAHILDWREWDGERGRQLRSALPLVASTTWSVPLPLPSIILAIPVNGWSCFLHTNDLGTGDVCQDSWLEGMFLVAPSSSLLKIPHFLHIYLSAVDVITILNSYGIIEKLVGKPRSDPPRREVMMLNVTSLGSWKKFGVIRPYIVWECFGFPRQYLGLGFLCLSP